MAIKTYDLIVIGAGSGLDVAAGAAAQGLKTAIVEKGPLGGTMLSDYSILLTLMVGFKNGT